MSLTTISLKKETKIRLKSIMEESENWDDLLNRLYEVELERIAAEKIFLSGNTIPLDEALKRLDY